MTFGAPFSRSVRPPFGPNTGGGYWWNLFGAIPNANVVAAYQPKGAASLAASYTNLANPGTYDAAPGVAPTWNAVNGWIFNGTKYLVTGVIPAFQTWSAICRFSNSGSAGYSFGVRKQANNTFGIYIDVTTPQIIYVSGGNLTISTLLANGVLGMAGNLGFRNGVQELGTIGAGTVSNNFGLFIGARNFENTSIDLYYNGYIQAFSIYNTALTAGQMTALTTAMNAL